MQEIEKAVKRVSNKKRKSLDGNKGFRWKSLSCTWGSLKRTFQKQIETTEKITTKETMWKTFLLYKKGNVEDPK